MLERARTYPGITNPDINLGLSKPELDIHIHRNKAADVGISVSTIGRTLQTLLGGRPVTTFDHNGKEYSVIVKVRDTGRVTPSDIHTLYVRGLQGNLVQLGNLLTIEETVAPRELYHYDKMRAAVMTGGVGSGYTLGDAVTFLEETARDLLPSGTPTRLAGESRQYKETNISLYLTFAVAFLVIYLVLAAEFESFLHPITILLSVPPAITGALLTLKLFSGTLNIYSQVGMIMLIGLVTKNAILIVDFADRLRVRGKALIPAVIEGAALRLRPVLMTTLATVLGAIPLALATGAGAAGRRQIGSVIVGGMVFSTILTLVIVPVVYAALCRRTASTARAEIETEQPAALEPMPADYEVAARR
jgi:multidrug efflux pump